MVWKTITQENLKKLHGQVFIVLYLLNKDLDLSLQLNSKKTLVQVFSCKFCEISKNTFSNRTPPVSLTKILQEEPRAVHKLDFPLVHQFAVTQAFHQFAKKLMKIKNKCTTVAAIRKCFVKKMFLKISPNSQENTCIGVSLLIKLRPL